MSVRLSRARTLSAKPRLKGEMALSHDPLWPRAGDWHTPTGEVDFGIIGVPTFSTSITPGKAHETPAAVRAAIPRYSETAMVGGEVVSFSRLKRHDFGDVADPDGNESGATVTIREAAERTRILVAIGGDNALTVPVARAGWGDSVLLQPHRRAAVPAAIKVVAMNLFIMKPR